ncbi:hypothetical protein N9L92_05600 [Saprospiraceae bacterium]|nr:hypothetical protein [Saprospiraceae bacterium]
MNRLRIMKPNSLGKLAAILIVIPFSPSSFGDACTESRWNPSTITIRGVL